MKSPDENVSLDQVPGCGSQNVSAKSVEQCKTETEDKLVIDLQQLNLTYIDLETCRQIIQVCWLFRDSSQQRESVVYFRYFSIYTLIWKYSMHVKLVR